METIVSELDRLISATRATWNLVNMVSLVSKTEYIHAEANVSQ